MVSLRKMTLPPLKLRKNVALSENGLIFNPSSGDSFSLNPVANEIIHLLRENRARHEIREAVLEKYDVDPSTFEKDFDDFVFQLREFRLVEE